MSDEFLFVERYRPKTIKDCILPKRLEETFSKIIGTGELPNMLFTGTAGTGKTTVAKALCNELGLDYIIINGSEEGGINTLRGKIKQFASTVSFTGGVKVVILDEADYLNATSTQPALRGFIEEFSNNCRFILTCNFKNKIIAPIHSRCPPIEFVIPAEERANIAMRFFKRFQSILEENDIKYEHKVLAAVVEKHFPDWRRVLGELQRYGVGGEINSGILLNMNTQHMDKLYVSLKAKDFNTMRKWVLNNIDVEPDAVFRALYDSCSTKVKPHSIPQLVLHLAEYSYKNAFVADHEINMVACLTEVMSSVEFI